MYIDPTLGKFLLEPLFQLQASPNYTIPYAAPDLGTSQQSESLEASITEDAQDRVTPTSQSAIPTTTKESNVCNFLSCVTHHRYIPDPFTESGNMLIMTYAHARASGDGSIISRYVRTELLFGPVKG